MYTQAVTVEVRDSSFNNSTSTNHGGALYCQSIANDSIATISGTRFENGYTTRSTDGAGGAIYSKNATLTLQKSEKAETTINNCKAPGYSGAVYMETSGSTLNIKDNTVISGCYANQGGAIYLKSGVTMNLTGSPEFTQNGYATHDGTLHYTEYGACIYLAEGSRINLSGSPKFSRNNIINVPRVTNGGIYDYVRQDLYLAGYSNKPATSIHVAGELTGDTIWVWPEQSPHRIANEQFATTATGVSSESLDKFRNALDDEDTNCTNGEFLAGLRLPGQEATNVYWGKMYDVFFKKIDNKAVAVPGAEFALYTDKACTGEALRQAVSADGETDTNAQSELMDKGTVDFPTIPIGVYYMKETRQPESFKENTTTYLVLVGTPSLNLENQANQELWGEGGPLNGVPNAADRITRTTTDAGKYYGIYPLNAEGKAILTANLASANVGIVNIRSDYQAYFMKVDGTGAALPNAAFTIYTLDQPASYENGYPNLKPWTRDGENYPDPVKSADGTSRFKDLNGNTLDKGLVYFRELPIGTYYLQETEYPTRNGSDRKTFYVESDRVFRLEVKGLEDFDLSEWQEDGTYAPCSKQNGQNGYYVVGNTEAVCKLTDANGNLLYTIGHDGKTLLPAIYPTLEAGFVTAQGGTLLSAGGTVVAGDGNDPALKLQVLKDCTMTSKVNYTSQRALTLTTAGQKATSSDQYTFTTNRTSDTFRAEIKRSYSETVANGALITVGNGTNGANLTLETVMLNGQKSSGMNGRAVHVQTGTLTVGSNTLLKNFQAGVNKDGGAVLMDSGTTLTINGGNNRSAEFIGNAATGDGGAIALQQGCTVNIRNAQFKNNTASGDGGAVSMASGSLPLTNAVFQSNTASGNGGAVYTGANSELDLTNSTLQGNSAAAEGGALYIGDGAKATVINGRITGNVASGTNGGAINVAAPAGENPTLPTARLYFEGSPYVYDNPSANSSQQKNVVLNQDSNGVINTTANGLTGGMIGVYTTDANDAYSNHGSGGQPFGTFGDLGRSIPEKAFVNDRNSKVYAVVSETEDSSNSDYYTIYWVNAGSLRVILRKMDEKNQPLEGAKFTIYPQGSTTPVTVDGKQLSGLTSGPSGVFYVGELPNGTYLVKETEAPSGYTLKDFTIRIEDGAVIIVTES